MLKIVNTEYFRYSVVLKDIIRENLSGANIDAYIATLIDLEYTFGLGNFRAVWEQENITEFPYRRNIMVVYVGKEEDATLIKLKYGY